MKSKTVRYTLETLPPLTEADRVQLRLLSTRPDSEIDTVDIPEIPPDRRVNVTRGRFYRPVKRQIRASLDADVLAWLKSQGRGYQSRLNNILRREMLKSLQPSKDHS